MTIALTVGGINIATQVYLTKSNFVSTAGPTPGTCEIAVADESLVQAFTIGDRILLTIDGLNQWAGYLTKIRRTYPFTAYSPAHVRQFVLLGSEISILFQRRIVYRLSNPTVAAPDYPPYTQDSTVFADLFSDYLSLSGDGIDVTTHVHNLGTINEDQKGSPIWASQPWGTTMRLMANHLSPVWGINADRKLIWADVDVESAPFGISDNPGVGEIGCANLEIAFDASEMINDALILGAGTGDDEPVWVRELAPASIATHGLWQMGMTAFQVYKQSTINKIADSWVHGSPSSHRGHKNDRVAAQCTVWEPGLRPGMVVHLVSGVWGWSDDIPIRQMRISWPAVAVTRYDLVLSHELDHPLTLTDPSPLPPLPQPPKKPKVIIVEGVPECTSEVCGYTDTFSRPNGGWSVGGPNDAGLQYGGVTGVEQFVQIVDGVGCHGFNARTPYTPATQQEVVAQFLPTYGEPPWEVVLNLGFDSGAISSGLGLTFYFGYTGSGTDTLTAFFGSDGGVDLLRNFAGPGDEVAFLPGGTFDFSTPYRVRMLATRTSLKVRLWRPADPEPTTWNVELACTEIPSTIGYIYYALANKQYINGVTYPQVYATIDDLNIRAGETYYNRCTKTQFDDFQRVESGTWGSTTPSGIPWTIGTTGGGYGTVFGVDGNSGTATLAQGATGSSNVNQYVTAGPWKNGAFTMAARVRIIGGASVGAVSFGISVGPNMTGIDAEVYFEPNFGDYGLQIQGVGPTGVMAFPDGWYRIKWQWTPGTDSTSSMKIWADGAVEPSAWMLTTTSAGTFPIPGYFTVWPRINFHSTGGDSAVQVDSIDFDYEGRPCYCVEGVVDDFNRSSGSSWGMASSGYTWTPEAVSSTVYSVDGSRGLITFDESTNADIRLTGFVPSVPLDMTFWATKISSTPNLAMPSTKANRVAYELTDFGSGLEVDITQRGLVQVMVGSFVGSHDFNVNVADTAGINVRVTSTDGMTNVQVYTWLAGDPQPTTPQITGTGLTGIRPLTTLKIFTGSGSFTTQTAVVSVDQIEQGSECVDPVATSVPETIEGRACSNFDGGTSTFNVHHEIWTGTVEVSVNGVSQPTSEVTATQDGVVTLSWTTEPGDKVRICYEIRDTNQ